MSIAFALAAALGGQVAASAGANEGILLDKFLTLCRHVRNPNEALKVATAEGWEAVEAKSSQHLLRTDLGEQVWDSRGPQPVVHATHWFEQTISGRPIYARLDERSAPIGRSYSCEIFDFERTAPISEGELAAWKKLIPSASLNSIGPLVEIGTGVIADRVWGEIAYNLPTKKLVLQSQLGEFYTISSPGLEISAHSLN